MSETSQLLLLDRDQAAALLDPEAVLEATREAFLLHASRAGRIFPLVREPLPNGIFGIKSGNVEDEQLLGFKAAGFWPGNRAHGADAHQATIMLFDPDTGRPQCLIDGNAVTTTRTAAAGAIGLLALARPESSSVCVFGTGVQAVAQLDYALRFLPSLRTVRYMASGGRRDEAFEARFAQRCDISPGVNANEAVAASDIVIAATPGRAVLFDADAVKPGTHINAVGSDTRGKRELPEGLLPRARVWADDLAQARTLGELQWSPGHPAEELGTVLASGAAARAAHDVTVFDMTGIALQDLTVARMLRQRALASGAGSSIAWPW
ncbi:ornithine cyclodeaminase family protein [Massilia endophytica]|uniref:ornithine cyclodeaminase family protein n=1 Tax=Massilia endophytica TaxID=2899220 RepID=UPI001E3B8908|nr:ornithine cyclodeaminase family protein [Massilia endophytica]UGQ45298.1 ornithine cyclodeaminase family protein [Massilia endophytica]